MERVWGESREPVVPVRPCRAGRDGAAAWERPRAPRVGAAPRGGPAGPCAGLSSVSGCSQQKALPA